MFHQSVNPMIAVVNAEIQRLKSLETSELVSFPESQERIMDVEGRATTVIVWHDELPSEEHRIVVQASQRRLFGLIGRACADGFAVGIDGKIRELTEAELSSFT